MPIFGIIPTSFLILGLLASVTGRSEPAAQSQPSAHGFNNTYAITVRAAHADEHGWEAISDLGNVADQLSAGFTAEFMERPDGYPGLRRAYGFDFGRTADLDPGLMYKALADGQVDVICAFATDGRIAAYSLRVLHDDRSFFPPYDAAPVIRNDLLRDHPEIRDALTPLAGTIDDREMRRMNFAVDELKQRPSAVARDWIEARGSGHQQSVATPTSRQADGPKGFWAMAVSRRAELWRKTLEHLWLTALAMGIAVLIGVPLGVLVYRYTTAVIDNLYPSVFRYGNLHAFAEAGHGFVHSVVQYLIDQMVQAALIGASDVHSRADTHRFQAL